MAECEVNPHARAVFRDWAAEVAEKGIDPDEARRVAFATALIQSGYDDQDDNDPNAFDLFQWRACVDCPRANGGCGCSGIPYISDEVWPHIRAALDALAAPARENADAAG